MSDHDQIIRAADRDDFREAVYNDHPALARLMRHDHSFLTRDLIEEIDQILDLFESTCAAMQAMEEEPDRVMRHPYTFSTYEDPRITEALNDRATCDDGSDHLLAPNGPEMLDRIVSLEQDNQSLYEHVAEIRQAEESHATAQRFVDKIYNERLAKLEQAVATLEKIIAAAAGREEAPERERHYTHPCPACRIPISHQSHLWSANYVNGAPAEEFHCPGFEEEPLERFVET